jgi:hypothetical protein
MAFDFELIKKNLILPYVKYWIIFVIFILLFLYKIYFSIYMSVDKITLGIQNSKYIGNGIVINNYQLITSHSMTDDSCWSKNHFYRGNLYAIDENFIYPLTRDYYDDSLDLSVLRIKTTDLSFQDYAVFDMDKPDHKINKRVILPKQKNRVSTYLFKTSRITDIENMRFLVATRNITRDAFAISMPILNSNYILQGIVKERNKTMKPQKMKDKILDFLGTQKLFEVINIENIKNFLDTYKVEYYVSDANSNMLDDERYDIKKSIVSIICIVNKEKR